MTSSGALGQVLDEVGRPLRALRGVVRLLCGVAIALGLLALVAWWARVSHAELSASVLWVWLGVIIALGVGATLARRAMRLIGPWWVASQLEDTGAWRRGALTHVLDRAAEGTSVDLRAEAIAGSIADVRARGALALDPAVMQSRRFGRYALAGVVIAALALAAARPLQGTPARLWDPIGAWSALTAPVRLVPRTPTVARGTSAVLELTATGHNSAVLYTRMPGEAWQTTHVALDADGHGEFTTAPLTAELIARLEAGGRSSAEVRVAIRLPAFLGSFVVTAHYPGYLGLDPETLPLVGDTLLLPQGTRLDITGRATVPLASVALSGPGGMTLLAVDGLAFYGALVPATSGTWQLLAKPAGGEALDGDAPTIPLRVLPDSIPVVDVPVPGVDTVAGASLQFPLLIALHDDHGLTGAMIEMHRGAAGPVTRMPLDVGRGQPDRALLSSNLDLAALDLHPGDTLHYQVVATDNTPQHQRGVSREYWVRVPTEAELRTAREAATTLAAARFDSLAAAATTVQRQTEDLGKERPRGAPTSSATGETEPMTADAARTAEAVVKAQAQLLKDAKQMEQAINDLRQAAEKQGVADSAFVAQLEELRQLMRQADSPELREALAALQQALKQLDPEATRNAMQQLAQRQSEFESAMKQARDLFKRAAMESDLSNLAQAAKQLSEQQRDLAPSLEKAAAQHADSAKARPDLTAALAIAKEKELATHTDSLAASIDRTAQRMPSDSVRNGLQKAADQTRDASQQMRQAAQSAEQGQPKASQDKAKAAQDRLTEVEQKVTQQKRDLQAAMKEEVLRALDRALAEATRLVQRQLDLVDAFRRGGMLVSTRAEQSLVDDGVGRLLAQVNVIGGKNALVPQQIGIALAASRVNMRNAVDAVASLSPDLATASNQAGEAVDGIAFAAFAMLRAKERVGQAESGSGMEEAIAELKQAAEQQGKAAGASGQRMQSGDIGPQQMLEMAMQQRAVAQQLERLRAGGQLAGAGEMAKEAKELERQLESGQFSRELVDRQQRLYKKMLDAGRQLQGEQDDDQRQRTAVTAKDGPISLPPSLDPRLRLGDSGIKLPGWEALQGLSPVERRRVLDYFQRLTEVKRP